MAKKSVPLTKSDPTTAMVAGTLAGVIYQAKLNNRQAKLNIPEHEIVEEVLNLWRTIMDRMKTPGN